MQYQNIKRNLLQINLFSYLHDGKNIFFCKTDFLGSAFSQIEKIKNNIILITGNSDYQVNDNIIKRAPKNIKHWFAQNANSDNIFGIPMGLENSIECKISNHGYVWPHAQPKHDYISTLCPQEPSGYIYANFSISTNSPIRKKVCDLCESIEYITTDICSDYKEINKKSFANYIKSILEHKMVVCPEGNGVDCHRVWETLLVGRIPIVKKSTAMNHFSELPILYVQDWEQLKDKKYIFSEYHRVKNNNKQKLQFKYWESLVLSLRNNL